MRHAPLRGFAAMALLTTLLFSPTLAHAQGGTANPAATKSYEVTDLGALGGEVSMASGINAAGQVVGTAEIAVEPGSTATPAATEEGAPPPSHAFIWEDGVMTDLNDLVSSGPEVMLGFALVISDAGLIAGAAAFGDEEHAFLLTPVD